MDKSSSEAPSPDPKIGEAALKQAQTGEDWLGFAKDSLAVSTARQADLDALTKQVTQQQMGIANDQAAWAKSDRERYDTVFKPVEDKFVAEASAYGSEAHQNEAAAEAKADVQNNAAGRARLPIAMQLPWASTRRRAGMPASIARAKWARRLRRPALKTPRAPTIETRASR
ncbi:hypothetical protein [Mesorhizobium huakuii]|uniref:Uncharacterized protein n=1 Tax=Mesorhizobium huakuii TaxID=28104 RepID=A0A7G6T0W0_9HYPH|nr:hypothetical protein [Mesorhizobium huakuii]QND60392.1 hypothetical protein HB778_30470 [Mesorhizobium huakuii]